MIFISESINKIYIDLCKAIIHGEKCSPRGNETLELENITVELSNPEKSFINLSSRNLSCSYAHGEFIWYITGNDSLSMIQHYSKKMKCFSDDKKTLSGAYGPKLIRGINKIIELLKNDMDSRRAVINLYDCDRDLIYSKDIPCTVSLHFLIRKNKLNLHTNMRSNDLFLGFPYDIYSFTLIQQFVASELHLEMGNYFHHINSLHVYKKDLEKVIQIANDTEENCVKSKGEQKDVIKYLNQLIQIEYQLRVNKDYKNIAIPRSKYCQWIIDEWKSRIK